MFRARFARHWGFQLLYFARLGGRVRKLVVSLRFLVAWLPHDWAGLGSF
jgi:hypothetical protein